MIKSILFDLDGTLRHNDPSGSRVFVEYARALGLPLHEEDIARAARWEHYYFANSPDIQADSQKFENDSFWTNFARRRLVALGCRPEQAAELAPQFSAYMAENYKPTSFVPEEVFPLLSTLKAAGYNLGMVSNRSRPFDEELKELGLDGYFNFTLAGGEVNAFKPDLAIFEEALRRAGTSAAQTIYVGDNYYADAVGARRAGLRPVLYDPSGLFPDPGCEVIVSFDQLTKLLG